MKMEENSVTFHTLLTIFTHHETVVRSDNVFRSVRCSKVRWLFLFFFTKKIDRTFSHEI